MGRVQKGTPLRSHMFRITATPAEKQLVVRAAQSLEMTESDFMRAAIQVALNNMPELAAS